MKFTADQIRDFLVSNMESEEPDVIIEIIKTKLNGKLLNVRQLEFFPGGSNRWKIRKQFGMTHLETKNYGNGKYEKDAFSFILGWAELNVVWDWKLIYEKNGQHFCGRIDRNKKRKEAIYSIEELTKIATVMSEASRIRKELTVIANRFEEVLGYGTPGNPEQYDFMKMCFTPISHKDISLLDFTTKYGK